MHHYYRSPYPGNDQRFIGFGWPLVGGLVGGLLGGALAAPLFYPRPFYGGFGPYPGFGFPGPGFGGYPYLY